MLALVGEYRSLQGRKISNITAGGALLAMASGVCQCNENTNGPTSKQAGGVVDVPAVGAAVVCSPVEATATKLRKQRRLSFRQQQWSCTPSRWGNNLNIKWSEML